MESPQNPNDRTQELLAEINKLISRIKQPPQEVAHGITFVRSELSELFRKGEAAVFCGAGVSLEPPAGLPDWNGLRDSTLEAIASQDPFLEKYLQILTSAPLATSPDKQGLTPEVVASAILGNCTGYFECFRSLEEGASNANHKYLAKLTKGGHLQYIFTTNFDRFIEQALQDEVVQFVVHRTEEEFQGFQHDPNDRTVHIFKLHGCISDPSTIVTTVEQQGKGLGPAKNTVLDTLLPAYNFVFWGYSGADLKLDLDYLRMDVNRDRARGFHWNFLDRDGNKEPINPHVQVLSNRYGDRSKIVHGKLPEVFDQFIDPSDRIERVHCTYEQEQAWKRDKDEKLKNALREWGGEQVGQLHACDIFAGLLQYGGRNNEALECYQYLITLCEKHGDNQALAATYNSIGIICRERGMFDEAIHHYEKAITIARTVDIRTPGLAAILRNLATAHGDKGDEHMKKHYLKEADTIAVEITGQTKDGISSFLQDGPSHNVINKLVQEGESYRAQGEFELALHRYGQAANVARNLGDQPRFADMLNSMGLVYRDQGKLDEAFPKCKRALKIARELGDVNRVYRYINCLGIIYYDRKQWDLSGMYFLEGVLIARQTKNKDKIASFLESLSGVQSRKKNYILSADYRKQALDIQEEIHDIAGAALSCIHIGIDYQLLKRKKEAASYYKRALEHYRSIKDPKGIEESEARLCSVSWIAKLRYFFSLEL